MNCVIILLWSFRRKHASGFVFSTLLLGLQIGLKPLSFAADGITWHCIVAYGCAWSQIEAALLSLGFSATLKMQFLLQGEWIIFFPLLVPLEMEEIV